MIDNLAAAQQSLTTAIKVLEQHDTVLENISDNRARFEMMRAGFSDKPADANQFNLQSGAMQNSLEKLRNQVLASLPEKMSWTDFRATVSKAQFQWSHLSNLQQTIFVREAWDRSLLDEDVLTSEEETPPSEGPDLATWQAEYELHLQSFYDLVATIAISDPSNLVLSNKEILR